MALRESGTEAFTSGLKEAKETELADRVGHLGAPVFQSLSPGTTYRGMTDLRDAAILAAIEAGKAILEIYYSGDFDVTVKGDDSPLTRADIASHEVIMRHLEPLGIPVLSEEGRDMPFSERSGRSELWIVDPIDGTKEFIKRNGEFTVNIALARDGVPVLGVIYVPVTGELYVGVEGEGAHKALCPADATVDPAAAMAGADRLPRPKGDRPYTARRALPPVA